jgi:hypothetical protein
MMLREPLFKRREESYWTKVDGPNVPKWNKQAKHRHQSGIVHQYLLLLFVASLIKLIEILFLLVPTLWNR